MRLTAKQYATLAVDVLDGKSGKELEEAAHTFLLWIKERQDDHRLPDVLRAIDDVWKERFGVATVRITTAHPLTRDARKAIEDAARGAALVDSVDPDLIGGACIRMDDRILDGSIRGHLKALKISLMQS